MSTDTTLYYPFIYPRDINCLKAALIYWDRVRRIVPNTVVVEDEDRDIQILTGRELLLNTEPGPYVEAAANQFFECVERLQPRPERFQIDVETAKDLASRNNGIHVRKLGYPVLRRLQSLGLAALTLGEDWVRMDDKVGALYMHCLASEMAKQMSVPLYTDSPADAAVGEALSFSPRPGDPTSENLVRLDIRMPSAQQLENIPMEDIADFAERRSGEKREFRTAIEGIMTTAQNYDDPNAMSDYLAGEGVRIKQAITNLNKTMDELKVGVIDGIAKITVPAGTAALAAFLPIPHVAAILASFGLAIAGISCYAGTRHKLREARASSPYHYLVARKEDLGIEAFMRVR